MRRRLFNILAAGSLVLFVAVLALWCRGRFAGDMLHVSLPLGERSNISFGFWHSLGVIGGEFNLRTWDHVTPAKEDNRRECRWNVTSRSSGKKTRWFTYSLRSVDERSHYPVRVIESSARFGPSRYSIIPATADQPSQRDRRFAPFITGWILLIPFGVLPTFWFSRWHRNRGWLKQGRCMTCGYDLTDNVSGTCPECGTAIPPRGAAAKTPSAPAQCE